MDLCLWFNPTLSAVFIGGFVVLSAASVVLAVRTKPHTLSDRLDPFFGPGLMVIYWSWLIGAWMIPFFAYLGYHWWACA